MEIPVIRLLQTRTVAASPKLCCLLPAWRNCQATTAARCPPVAL